MHALIAVIRGSSRSDPGCLVSPRTELLLLLWRCQVPGTIREYIAKYGISAPGERINSNVLGYPVVCLCRAILTRPVFWSC